MIGAKDRFTMKFVWLMAATALLYPCFDARADVIEVTQIHRSFQPDSVDIRVGETVRIVNNDEFIHNVYVDSPTFQFDSEEQLQGHTQDIVFTQVGDFEVHCHIHLKMKLMVHVHGDATRLPSAHSPAAQGR